MSRITIGLSLILCFSVLSVGAQSKVKLTASEMQIFVGKWKGTLTYLDYTAAKPYTMLANLNVREIAENTLEFSHEYPDEPKANAKEKVELLKKGTQLNEEKLIEKRVLDNGDLEITTEYLGKDGNDNKAARIRHRYAVGKREFSLIKEVQFVGEKKWLKRNESRYQRAAP